MLIAAIILFACAAAFGLLLVSYVLTSRETPKGIAFIHGPLAVAGFICLLIGTLSHPTTLLIVSTILFALAATGGVITLGLDLTGHKIPKPLAVVHGLTAVIAFLMLVMSVWHASL